MEENWSVGSCQPLAHRRRQQAFEPHDVYRLLGNLLCLVALVTKLFLVFLLLHNFEVFIEISRHSAILKKIKDIGIGETTTESRFPGTLSPKLEPGLLHSSFTASSVHCPEAEAHELRVVSMLTSATLASVSNAGWTFHKAVRYWASSLEST